MDTIEEREAGGDGATEARGNDQMLWVPLSRCRFGIDCPGGSINVRKTNRGASRELVASIKAEGVIEPLIGREHDGLYYFMDGDRRLDGLFQAHCAARRPNNYPVVWGSVDAIAVPVRLQTAGDPIEIGLQAQLNRENLHPVDRMEAFAELLARGRSVEDLAAAFSLRVAQVKTSLRLGALAPAIRAAWRAGAIEAQTAEAFILCRDEKQQVKIFDRLTAKAGPGGRVTPHMVRSALKAQPGEVRRLLAFVGRETAAANGIEIAESLFSIAGLAGEGDAVSVLGEPTVHNVAGLKALAERKLADAAVLLTRLPKSEGGPWGWAKPADAMPPGWQAWPRMILDRPLKIKDRESVGCVVAIDGDGKLAVEEALYWKDEPAAAGLYAEGGAAGDFGTDEGTARDPAVGGAEATPPAATSPTFLPRAPAGSSEIEHAAAAAQTALAERELPPRLQQQLAEQLQAGLRAALEKRNDLALPLLLAGLAAHGDVIAIDRMDGPPADATRWPFEEVLGRYLAMDQGAQLRALAGIVAQALTLRIESGATPPAFMAGPQALIAAAAGAMGAARLKAHLVAAFDVDSYVKAAPKPALLAAIGEACGAQQREKLERKGRREIEAFARVNLAEKKWLPPELGADVLCDRAAPRKRAAAAAKMPARKSAKKSRKKKGRR